MPSVDNTLLTDPCFTNQGFRHALRQLRRLDISFTNIGQIFVTHTHGDHLLNFPYYTDHPEFAYLQGKGRRSFKWIDVVPCPGHSPDLKTLSFRSSSDQRVWIAGDAVLNLKWLKVWGYYWPNDYSASEIIQTWRSVAKILSHADLIIPGHGRPIPVTTSLLRGLLATFASAPHASRCLDVEGSLNERLAQLSNKK
jgi:glyoxylase-like metal-dependent hydrolase (beta-lactamase superfamily II)